MITIEKASNGWLIRGTFFGNTKVWVCDIWDDVLKLLNSLDDMKRI